MQAQMPAITDDLIAALQRGGPEATAARKVIRHHAKSATSVSNAVPNVALKAAKTLKEKYGLDVSVAALAKFGWDVITEQTRLTGGRHPATASARAFFKAVLFDMMIERATAH